MQAIKKPIPIEVAEFTGGPSFQYQQRPKIGGGFEIWNALHGSWIGIEKGDYINVTNPQDTYPIQRKVFEETYDVVV